VIDAEAIAPLLERHRESLANELGRLEGLVEMGAKLLAVSDALLSSAEQSSEAVRALDAELDSSAPGRAYLLKRRREAALSDALEDYSRALIDAVRSRLSAAAVDTADLPLPSVLPADREVLGNFAFLLPDKQMGEFMAAADEAARQPGTEIELSGPWPPYSFVRLNLADERP